MRDTFFFLKRRKEEKNCYLLPLHVIVSIRILYPLCLRQSFSMCSSPFPSYLLICCHYLFILKKWKILSLSLCLWITYTLWKLVLLHEFLIKILFPRYFENKNARLGFGSPSSLRYCSFFSSLSQNMWTFVKFEFRVGRYEFLSFLKSWSYTF